MQSLLEIASPPVECTKLFSGKKKKFHSLFFIFFFIYFLVLVLQNRKGIKLTLGWYTSQEFSFCFTLSMVCCSLSLVFQHAQPKRVEDDGESLRRCSALLPA